MPFVSRIHALALVLQVLSLKVSSISDLKAQVLNGPGGMGEAQWNFKGEQLMDVMGGVVQNGGAAVVAKRIQ